MKVIPMRRNGASPWLAEGTAIDPTHSYQVRRASARADISEESLTYSKGEMMLYACERVRRQVRHFLEQEGMDQVGPIQVVVTVEARTLGVDHEAGLDSEQLAEVYGQRADEVRVYG